MKTAATPKDILFVTMLSITCLIGYLGFYQSAKIKLQQKQVYHSESQSSNTIEQQK